METENEIQKVEPTAMQQVQPVHPPIPADAPLMTRVAMMMERGIKIDTDQMSKMLEIAERLKATVAREAYAADFAVVQANIDAAVKTAYNPQTKSNYAKLEGVIEASKPAYTAQGFSVVFSEGETEKPDHIRVCADVLHRDGHKESSHYDVPLGGVGIAGKVNMTAIHAKATSVTYGRRYLLCMIWNIPTEDDDGNRPAEKPIAVDPPDSEELVAIEEIASQIVAPQGMRVDTKKVGALCYEKNGGYPDMAMIGRAVAWFAKFDRPEIFIPDNRSSAEKQLDLPGDEDSQPDDPAIAEAEETAAAKFGEENDTMPYRYVCNTCGYEFDEFKMKGVCPNSECLGRDIHDRTPDA